MRALAAASALALVVACATAPDPGPPLPEGRVALRLRRLDGGHLNVASLRGRVVLLTVFATWSEPALLEVPLFAELDADYGDALAVVGVALDENPEMIRIFVESFEVPFEVTRPDDLARFTGRQGPFGVIDTVPTSVLIDRDGRVAARTNGVWPPAVLREAVRRLVRADARVAADPQRP